MKILILVTCLNLFFCRPGISQQTTAIKNIVNASEYKAVFKDHHYFRQHTLPFKDIVVLDYRYDSSKIGYTKNGNGYKRIKLEEGWTKLINEYFAANLEQSSKFTMVIAIRSFWLQEGIINETHAGKVVSQPSNSSEYSGKCVAELDIYIQNDTELYPLFKIEDTFLNFYKFKPRRLEEWLFLPFDSVAHRIPSTDFSSTFNKRKLSFGEVHSYYKKRFDIPALTQPLKTGVFLTFEDFKNNKPVAGEYQMAEGRLTDELYEINGEQRKVISEFWGFYNGKDLYIHSVYSIYPSVQQQNSFEVFGGTYVSLIVGRNKSKINNKILQMNMERGTFY